MKLEKNGVPLLTIEDWRAHAPPRSADHWVRGRAPLECATAWFGKSGPTAPSEIMGLLASHPDTASVEIVSAIPQYQLQFDGIKEETHDCDLVALADSEHGALALVVEAKADERFERPVEQVVSQAVDRKAHGERTSMLKRVEQLAAALLPPPRRGLPPLGPLRYPLLAAAAGALAYAKEAGASRAVLVIHEFATERAEDRTQTANYADLSDFVARLSDGKTTSVEAGRLVGPFTVPGEPLFTKPAALYIGKAVRRLRPA